MRVLLVNTYDKGGAANSCIRLHMGLGLEKIDSKLLLKNKTTNWSKSFRFKEYDDNFDLFSKIINKIKRILIEFKIYNRRNLLSDKKRSFLKNRTKGLEIFTFPHSDINIMDSDLYKEAEIINLHWVANFLDFQSFFEKNIKPVVWTLHDMNPFTGGEHYEEEYLGIDHQGYPIKRFLSEEETIISKENLAIKLQALSNVTNLIIVSPSNWLAEKASKSELFKNRPIYVIPYSLDSTIYNIRDKNYSRELLGIPIQKKVILFVAESIDNNRKGFVFLKKAFEQLENSNLVLCAIGKKGSNLEAIPNILELGPINDERLMSIAYSAADMFVIPSLMDNLPNTVLESLMCGTPVIGFPIGGIPDMIQDGKNGYITKEISVDSLIETINKFLINPSCFNKMEIRNDAVMKYDLKVQSQKYIDLFHTVLNK